MMDTTEEDSVVTFVLKCVLTFVLSLPAHGIVRKRVTLGAKIGLHSILGTVLSSVVTPPK